MADTKRSLQTILRQLYFGDTVGSRAFRYALLLFDLVTIGYFIVSSMIVVPYFRAFSSFDPSRCCLPATT